ATDPVGEMRPERDREETEQRDEHDLEEHDAARIADRFLPVAQDEHRIDVEHDVLSEPHTHSNQQFARMLADDIQQRHARFAAGVLHALERWRLENAEPDEETDADEENGREEWD